MPGLESGLFVSEAPCQTAAATAHAQRCETCWPLFGIEESIGDKLRPQRARLQMHRETLAALTRLRQRFACARVGARCRLMAPLCVHRQCARGLHTSPVKEAVVGLSAATSAAPAGAAYSPWFSLKTSPLRFEAR